MKNTSIITPNQHALIRLPSEGMKVVELKPDQIINLGKFGSFKVNEILGYSYGQAFEILDDYMVRPIKSLMEDQVQPMENESTQEEEGQFTRKDIATILSESSENNQFIIDVGSQIQKLSSDDIDKLKNSGVSSDVGQQIIDKIIEGHAGFDKKTLFSQQKYLKRKQAKFFRRFSVDYLGGSQLLEYFLEKDNQRVFDMTTESLGLLFSYANVKPGGKYLLIDETGGVILYALMERMNGEGSIVSIHENEHPNHILLRNSDYTDEMIDRMVKPINWLQFVETNAEKINWKDEPEDVIENMKATRKAQYYRQKKRAQDINHVIDLVSEGNFDAFISVSKLHMPSVLPYILPKVGGSRPIAIYSEYKERLLETQHFLSVDRRILAPSIYESKVRHYQTIPGRMHPVMSSRGLDGYVLTGTRVYPKQEGITAVGRGISKKRRAQDETEKS
ncbi:Piso0_004939 [Millerozyma farinosa CBS 7064]|uniref:tRNA (adenine(58)-N(1))-methyltransferase non-catalytic subunit TRM6 n=1 Tax=Pichia sorbitophila (strain ATCC MYA-4447 / BCRC 22081 / CBS 7064 / NBRC 10061 / NRRL Y-12695) TaxID=559304 RepID=G8Y0U6_PICSO|nr:Piso0_004939 [Millerozyma farinosa CBS 7064]